jgi:hypothetical protein
VSLRFLLFAGCVSIQSACQPPAAAPAAPAAAPPVPIAQPVAPPPAVQLADRTWTVQGTRVPGSRFCGEWLVRLTSAGGQLSGTVSHARVTVPIQNLVLMPDGSFSRTTQASMSGSRRGPPSTVTGRFSGYTVGVASTASAAPRVKPRPSDAQQAPKVDTANTTVRPFRVLSCIPRVGRCALVAAVPLMPATKPAAAASAIQLADGTWMVQVRVGSGSRYCSDRLVRLTKREGQLSGPVGFARASAYT